MLSAFAIIAALLGADPVAYAKPDLLMEAEVLAKSPVKYHILDARAKASYDAGHVPGAVQLTATNWTKTLNEGKADAAFWKAELANAGVSPGKPAVVYGSDAREYCRVWWLLKTAGVPDVRVLNGGWDSYMAAKGETELKVNATPAAPHDWKPDPGRRATKDDVLARVTDKKETVFDARSADEFAAGRVPAAKPLEWNALLDAKTGKFKPAADLAAILTAQNFDPDKPCVTYCQSGGRASVLAFGLELMGAKTVRNYYRSWTEWGPATDTPKEK